MCGARSDALARSGSNTSTPDAEWKPRRVHGARRVKEHQPILQHHRTIMLQSFGSCEFLEMPLGPAAQAPCPCRALVISPKQCFATPWVRRPMEVPAQPEAIQNPPVSGLPSGAFPAQVSTRSGPLQTSGTVVAEAHGLVSSYRRYQEMTCCSACFSCFCSCLGFLVYARGRREASTSST